MGKKKQVTTLVNFVLDETGSMAMVKGATISGFNEYLGTLKESPNPVLLTLTLFNSCHTQIRHNAVPIADVAELNDDTYSPNCVTPLYDAIGQGIRSIEQTVSAMKTSPAVLFVVMTDGLENASQEFTQKMIFDLIQQKEREGWTFLYLGANQDAWAVGASFGMSAGNSMTYDAKDPQGAMAAAALGTAQYMASGSVHSKEALRGIDVNDVAGNLRRARSTIRSSSK